MFLHQPVRLFEQLESLCEVIHVFGFLSQAEFWVCGFSVAEILAPRKFFGGSFSVFLRFSPSGDIGWWCVLCPITGLVAMWLVWRAVL
jgi:hypothetical protein